MKIQRSKIAVLFQLVFGIVLVIFTGIAIHKYVNGIGIEQNSAGAYSHPLADLAIIGMFALAFAVFHLVRWFQRRDERDFVKKYKK